MRIKYLDIAKGILIMLLVFSHFTSAVRQIPIESDYFHWVGRANRVFTIFFMPAFFIISGYCSNFNKNISSFLISRTKSLIVPLITFSIINCLYYSLVDEVNFFQYLYSWILDGASFWFLQALFIGEAIILTLRKVKLGVLKILLVTFALLFLAVFLHRYVEGINLFYYRHAMIASFWIAVGVYLKDNERFYEKSLKWSFLLYPLVVIMSQIYAPYFTAGIGINIVTIPLHLFYAFVGSTFVLAICKKINANSFLQYWGRNSLVVYGFHFPPLVTLTAYFWGVIQPNNIFLFISFLLLLYVTEYSICWIIMKIFERKPFSVLIGKF